MTGETVIYLRIPGRTVRIQASSAVVGRSRTCDVQIDDAEVSRRHCEIFLRPDGVFVRDLGSTRGTWREGRRLRGEERLPAGVRLTLGENGPEIEVASALLDGRPAQTGGGPRPDLAPHAVPPVPAATEAPTVAVKMLPPAPPPPPAPPRFAAGLAWGAAAGVAVSLLVLMLLSHA
jgi:DNA segregation ATPase FtsK/SpoIIIE, S-DNA-T family